MGMDDHVDHGEREDTIEFFLLASIICFSRAQEVLLVDYELMDVQAQKDESAGFQNVLEDITIKTFDNDN
jgi:hypothetical protein